MADVDAKGLTNGAVLMGQGASGSLVRGFTVKNANQEGVLALQTSWVTIEDNAVVSNDQGIFLLADQQTGECAAQGEIPGDCGEGLHLMSVTHAVVRDNQVEHNAGGILLSDEFGPTAYNNIVGNHASYNLYDCGITIVSHSATAYDFVHQALRPSLGGVYDNSFRDNTANGNGVKGEGAGFVIGVAMPGSAVYDNTIANNTANDNGLAGITLHSHVPAVATGGIASQVIDGNEIIGNTLSHDNVVGDPDAQVFQTTGILILGATPVTGTVVKDNRISNVHFGIWTANVPPIDVSANEFHNVAVPVQQQ